MVGFIAYLEPRHYSWFDYACQYTSHIDTIHLISNQAESNWNGVVSNHVVIWYEHVMETLSA